MAKDAVPVSRRDVLRAGLAAPAIFGLGALFGCEPAGRGEGRPVGRGVVLVPPPPQDPAAAPDWWPQFLQRAREGSRAAIVVRVPRDAAARRALGTALVELTDRGTLDQRLVMRSAAIACLTDAQMRVTVPSARPDDGLVALGDGAERVDGAPLPADVAADPARLAGAIERLANGADGARLAARARAARATVAPATLAAYDALATEQDRRVAASSILDLLPLVASERRGTLAPERRAALDRLLDDSMSGHLFARAHTMLNVPFGVEADSEGGGCGGVSRDGATVVACGMALPTPGSFRFLHFLVDRGA